MNTEKKLTDWENLSGKAALENHASRFFSGADLINKLGWRESELLEYVKSGALIPLDKKGEPLESPVVEGARKSLAWLKKTKDSIQSDETSKDIDMQIKATEQMLSDHVKNPWGFLRLTGNEKFDEATMSHILKAEYLVSEVKSLSEKAVCFYSTKRKNQIDKEFALKRAKDYWRKDPNLSLEEMVEKIQYRHAHDGKPFFSRDYADSTIRNWIRDLSPNHSKGKPGRKKKSTSEVK